MYHAVRAPVPPPTVAPPNLDLRPVPEEEHIAAREYNDLLDRLTGNSKEIIDNLTMIAGENLNNANGIVHVIECRILTAMPMSKLPYLYLVDSILKNVGNVYIYKFSLNLYNTFRNVYSTSTPNTRASLHRLLNTWPNVFGPELVSALRRCAEECDSITASTAPVRPLVTQGYNAPVVSTRIPRVPPSRQVSLAPNYQNVNRSNHPARTGSIAQVSIPKRPTIQPSPAPNMVGGVVPASLPLPISHQIPPTQSIAMATGQMGAMGMQPLYHQGIRQQQPVQQVQQLQRLPGAPTPGYNSNTYHMQQPQQTMQVGPMGAPIGMPVGGIYEGLAKVERLMVEITRKRAVGIVATNDEVYLTSLIAEQLRAQPPYPDRMRLIELQRRLTNGSVAQPQTHYPVGPRAVVPTPSFDPGALSNLVRSLPTSITRPPMKFADVRTASHTAFVRALYTDLTHLSKSDAMRFATKDELRLHLDWLFARNRRKRARDRNLATGGLSRCWYDHVDVFIGEKSNAASVPQKPNDPNDAAKVPPKSPDPLSQSVDARGDDEICPACREGFTTYWDEEEQKWRIKEAVRNDNGTAFHTRCAASINDINTYEESQLTPASSTKALPIVSVEVSNSAKPTVNLFGVPEKINLVEPKSEVEPSSTLSPPSNTMYNRHAPGAPVKQEGEEYSSKLATIEHKIQSPPSLPPSTNHVMKQSGTSLDELKQKTMDDSTRKRKMGDVMIGDGGETVKRAKVENVENVQVVAGK